MNGSDERMERRLQKIEEAQAFDQRTVEILSEQVRQLGERIDRLTRHIARLEERLSRTGAPDDSPGLLDDPGSDQQ